MTAVKGKLVNNLRRSSDRGQIMRQLFGECHRELPSVQEGKKINSLDVKSYLLVCCFFFFFFLPTDKSRNNDLCWPGCFFVSFFFTFSFQKATFVKRAFAGRSHFVSVE